MAKRIKIGDIIEIPVGPKFAYAQYTHHHKAPPRYGALIRVFADLSTHRREEFAGLPESEVQFVTFFPVQAAVDKGIVSVVSNQPIPFGAQKFPVFRSKGIEVPGMPQLAGWWLWDGRKEWRVGELEPEQKALPIRGVVNDTLLIERILSDWRPEKDKL
jgi:hypothetical protein